MKKLTTDEYKTCILNIMIKIDQICRDNSLNYMICFGTLLGAVRHNGFIPWDDDIDIVMPREDYYKLGKYIINHPELGLNYIDISNREDTIYYCAKVCDAKTIVKESLFKSVRGYGAFVDVFPLDYLPNCELARKQYLRYGSFLLRIVQHSSKTAPGKGRNIKQTVLKNLGYFFGKFFKTGNVIRYMHNRYIKFNNNKTEYIGIPCTNDVFKKNLFEERIELSFEGYMFYAPKETHEILKICFGDYMKFPPEKNRKYKHNIECYLIES